MLKFGDFGERKINVSKVAFHLCKIVSSCTEFSVATTQCYSDDSKFTAKVVTVHKTNIDYHVAALSYAVERRGLMSLKQNS